MAGSATVVVSQNPDAYDPRIPMSDPYDVYRVLRDRAPVLWNEPAKTWIVTGHEVATQIMRDDATFHQAYDHREVSRNGEQVRAQPYFQMFRRMFFMMDGADHQRLRPLFGRWFQGPNRMRELTPMVERVTKEVLGELEDFATFDIVRQFAYPLPLRVISELLSVPSADSAAIAHDLHDIAPVVESVQKSPEVKARADAAIVRVHDYFRDLVKERRRALGDDLLSAMIVAFDAGNFQDEEELLANALLMYFAGHETTTDSISLAVFSLFRNPEQLAQMKANLADPKFMRAAVEELLRYDGTAQGFSRAPVKDVVVNGNHIAKGTFMLLLLGAANRDPAVFTDPDKLVFERSTSKMVSFGGGAHVCIGNMLARAELQIGLSELLRRKPNLSAESIDPPPSDFKASLTRGLLKLKVHS